LIGILVVLEREKKVKGGPCLNVFLFVVAVPSLILFNVP
jgi:hypothetical protein